MTVAKLKLAHLTLTRIGSPLVALQTVVASAGWSQVPEVLRTPAETTIRSLHSAELAATAVVSNNGLGELRVLDAKASRLESL